MQPYVCIDIETVPDEERQKHFDIKPPGIKWDLYVCNPEKMEYTWKCPIWADDEYKDHLIKQMSVTPEFNKIIGLGWKESGMEFPPESAYVSETINEVDVTETLLLKKFWHIYKSYNGRIAGYNIVRFDIPTILTRSLALGVDVPQVYRVNAKPWERQEVDLMLKRWPPNGYGAMPLKSLVKAYKTILDKKFEIPKRYEEIAGTDGGSVYELWEAGDIKNLKLYVELDVLYVDWLMELWGGYFV